MATDWDKLSKLRRDYPKAKFALSEITRQLKKQPRNPYLWAWKADVSLQLGTSGSEVNSASIKSILEHRPPITDTRLLVYTYNIFAEASRKHDPKTLSPSSMGSEIQKAWGNAAKALPTRKARLDLWSDLFTCAMKEDCWEDVRWTLIQAAREGVKSKKTLDFTLILANQLVYQRELQRLEGKAEPAQMVQIQLSVAYSKLKQAFLNASKPGDDLIKIESIGDLRFMAQVFRLQNKHGELIDLWCDAAPTLTEKLNQNLVETQLIVIDCARVLGRWDSVYNTAMADVRSGSGSVDTDRDPQTDALVRSWKLWSLLLEAVEQKEIIGQKQPTKVAEVRADIGEELFIGLQQLPFDGREESLTRLAVTSQLGRPDLLPLCKAYWVKYFHLNSCFQDLRRFVEQLPLREQQNFHKFISESVVSEKPWSETADEKASRRWLRIEVNVIKFDYLLTISCAAPDSVSTVSATVVEEFVNNAIRLYSIGVRIKDDCYHDAGTLAVMGLVILHTQIVEENWNYEKIAERPQANFRLLLQAGFLLLHATAGDSGKQNRPLHLLSTRLHLHLGLVTIAFAQYSQVRVKEILQDTLSHHFLSRISQIHPFDAKGPKGFSPDAELSRVISTIQRMESKTDDFLYTGMQDFLYDQAIELLEFKHKLKSSLSKHLCLIERRRIARFNRVNVSHELDLPLEDYNNISDNREFDAIPDFESTRHKSPATRYIHVQQPLPWIYERYEYEAVCKYVFKETRDDTILERSRPNREGHNKNGYLFDVTEEAFRGDWAIVKNIVTKGFGEDTLPHYKSQDDFELLLISLGRKNGNIKHLVIPETTSAEPADDMIMPHQGGLMYLYGHLEILQLVYRLCESTKDILKKPNNKLKGTVSLQIVAACAMEAVNVYSSIQTVATSQIKALKQRGVNCILAQVRWSATGVLLRELMTDDQQRRYAQDYVESAVEALEGVLMVKLK